MGKRSQAKGKWLTMSQRQAKGEAQSGARLWFLNPRQPRPATPPPIPPRGRADAEAVSDQAPELRAVQAAQAGAGAPVASARAGAPEGVGT